MPDDEFAARLRVFDERQAVFLDRLDMFDQRDLVLLQRLERLREQVDLLAGQTGQFTDTIVEHKSDPHAHTAKRVKIIGRPAVDEVAPHRRAATPLPSAYPPTDSEPEKSDRTVRGLR